MGTHAEVLFFEDDEVDPIVFYQHYDGYNIQFAVADGLFVGQDRWNDPTYLARIIFTQMTNRTDSDSLGFGISKKSGMASQEHTVKVFSHYNNGTHIEFHGETYSAKAFMMEFSPKRLETLVIEGHSHDAKVAYVEQPIVEGSWVNINEY